MLLPSSAVQRGEVRRERVEKRSVVVKVRSACGEARRERAVWQYAAEKSG